MALAADLNLPVIIHNREASGRCDAACGRFAAGRAGEPRRAAFIFRRLGYGAGGRWTLGFLSRFLPAR
jgi:hypothetical protein